MQLDRVSFCLDICQDINSCSSVVDSNSGAGTDELPADAVALPFRLHESPVASICVDVDTLRFILYSM